MTVRPAVDSDAAGIMEIWNAVIRDTLVTFNPVEKTLPEVVAFYSDGAGDTPPLNLTAEEQADLVAFLESLTGDAPSATEPELPDYALRVVGEN